ncbi:chromate efflux transporter [Spartinivicinus poritis]|uniref:Chromate efflux transporter n=1 Tax=Spartinivicinus poritis TaxID=2994640 RepID=A0ABT5U3D3_9GAMM|nr:chromate efflux transporter [Spartinivicinus sp. A2-2]MDE1460871.1 chromate efflux transporter [Spartinivicinus sp. A2-2]
MEHKKTTNQSAWSVFLIFLRLGLTSFGGPVAHLGYFRDEFVIRRQWLTEKNYADLVALCQFLPGPASSQVGLALGISQAGYLGAFAAWLGFTLPSAFMLVGFALGIAHHGDMMPLGVLHGLKVVAVAVVAQAVWGMACNLCPDRQRVSLMACSACGMLFFTSVWAQVGVIICAGLVGMLMVRPTTCVVHNPMSISISRRTGGIWILLFIVLLVVLPTLTQLLSEQWLAMVDSFYRAGALVFGGGHVVLPLLQAEVVPSGWVTNEAFLAGYGAAQAVPGPLFTFAAYLGASMTQSPTGWLGGILCLIAIFIPSFLLVAGALPFWEQLRANAKVQAALTGINASVVGLLLAALYQPVWSSAIQQPQDFAVALVAFIALMFWKLPPWLVVLSCGLIGWLLNIAL